MSGTTTTTYDAAGNITKTTDGQGRATSYTHTPTGEVESITYHDGTTESFTSMDTYRGNAYAPASLHRYTYAQNNPQMYNDPSGL